MVLESLVSPKFAESRPSLLIFIGFLYATIGLFLSLWIFEEYASLVMIFLTSIACIPLIYNTIKYEEGKSLVYQAEKKLLFEHSKAISFLLYLFVGAAISYTIWYLILPVSTASTAFSAQTQTIISLNQKLTGNVTQFDILGRIFMNNVKVLVFCIIFSFIYCSGAIFILMWNASVIGVAIGNFIRTNVAKLLTDPGVSQVGSYMYVVSLTVLRYAVHGIPEILAYVIAGLAGGIVSVAIIKHDFSTKNFERIVLDASDMILISIAVLFFAAMVEVYITPMFF